MQNNVTSRRRENQNFVFLRIPWIQLNTSNNVPTQKVFCVLFSKEMHDARQDNGSAASSASFTHTTYAKRTFCLFQNKRDKADRQRGYRTCYTFCTHTHTHTPTWEKKKENLSVLMPYVIEMRVAVRASTMKTTRRIKY